MHGVTIKILKLCLIVKFIIVKNKKNAQYRTCLLGADVVMGRVVAKVRVQKLTVFSKKEGLYVR